FRTTAIHRRPRDLRQIRHNAQAVAQRECCKRDVFKHHPASILFGREPARSRSTDMQADHRRGVAYRVLLAGSTKARPLGPMPLPWMITGSRTSTKCATFAGSV